MERLLRYPSPEELLTLGLCPVCLNGGESPVEIPLGSPSYTGGPVATSHLPAFTVEEIENALEALNV